MKTPVFRSDLPEQQRLLFNSFKDIKGKHSSTLEAVWDAEPQRCWEKKTAQIVSWSSEIIRCIWELSVKSYQCRSKEGLLSKSTPASRGERSCSEEKLRFRNMKRWNEIDGLDEEGISVQMYDSLIKKYVAFCWCTEYSLHSLYEKWTTADIVHNLRLLSLQSRFIHKSFIESFKPTILYLRKSYGSVNYFCLCPVFTEFACLGVSSRFLSPCLLC